MLDGLLNIEVPRVRLCQLLVCLRLLRGLVIFLGNVQEVSQVVDRLFNFALLLVDETDLLVTLTDLYLVFGVLGGLKTLLEVLECLIEIVLFLLLQGNGLVHTDELLADTLLKCLQFAILLSRVFGRYQIIHGVVDVADLLLALATTHVRLGYSLVVLVLSADVHALLVAIRSRLKIMQLFELLGNFSVLLQALVDLAASVEVFGTFQFLTQFLQILLALLELLLLTLLLSFVLIGVEGLDLARRRLRGDVVEVDEGLEVAHLYELDGLELGVDAVLQFIIVVLVLEIVAAAGHVLLVLVEAVAKGLLAVLVDHRRLRLQDELFALLALRLLLHLAHL